MKIYRVRNNKTGNIESHFHAGPALFDDGSIAEDDCLFRVEEGFTPEFNTGKKDRNGKYIFQGDITNHGLVVFEDAGFKFEGGSYIGLMDSSEIEIIS